MWSAWAVGVGFDIGLAIAGAPWQMCVVRLLRLRPDHRRDARVEHADADARAGRRCSAGCRASTGSSRSGSSRSRSRSRGRSPSWSGASDDAGGGRRARLAHVRASCSSPACATRSEPLPRRRVAASLISSRWRTFATSSASSLGRGLEPAVEDLPEQRLARGAQGQGEHVGVVPAPRAAGGLGVGAERGADARHLVRGDRGARAGPAADDALLGAALGHVAGGGLAGPGPVVALVGLERAVQHRLVAAARAAPRPRPRPRPCARRRPPRSSCGAG